MINTMGSKRGFTIVELLIVIVVIGILASITIVAYNGVQGRAKTAAGQSLANSIDKKAETWNAIQGSYPTFAQLKTNNTNAVGTGSVATPNTDPNYAGSTAGPMEAKLDTPSVIIQETLAAPTTPVLTATTASDGKVVSYFGCAAGANIWYWDYTKTTAQITKTTAGAGC